MEWNKCHNLKEKIFKVIEKKVYLELMRLIRTWKFQGVKFCSIKSVIISRIGQM